MDYLILFMFTRNTASAAQENEKHISCSNGAPSTMELGNFWCLFSFPIFYVLISLATQWLGQIWTHICGIFEWVFSMMFLCIYGAFYKFCNMQLLIDNSINISERSVSFSRRASNRYFVVKHESLILLFLSLTHFYLIWRFAHTNVSLTVCVSLYVACYLSRTIPL